MVDPQFWHNKKVLVTGHTGFKGSWLTLCLLQMGAQVSGYALAPNTNPNLFDLLHLQNDIHHHIGDIRDLEYLNKVVSEQKPEIIIHMAAQPLVRYGYDNPIETFATNALGTAHILEAARASSHTHIILNITTDKVYQNQEWCWGYRENDRLGGVDPYSASKACSEIISHAYDSAYFTDKCLATARAGNVIGGGDWSANRLLPDIINACLQADPVILRYPNATRPWQHVLEPLNAYLMLIEKMAGDKQYCGAWNFGPNQESHRCVSWITDYVIHHWHKPLPNWQLAQDSQLHESNTLTLDISKAKNQLNWQPKWTINQALDYTIAWYQAWQANENLTDFSLNQINTYQTGE